TSGDGHGSLDRNLLTDDRSHALLEGVEGGWQAQPRVGRNHRAEQRISGEMREQGGGIGVQVEHLAYSRHQRWSLFGQAVAELQFEAVLLGQRADAEPATSFTQAHAAAVAQRFERLDAG